jgi:hypothetical protein
VQGRHEFDFPFLLNELEVLVSLHCNVNLVVAELQTTRTKTAAYNLRKPMFKNVFAVKESLAFESFVTVKLLNLRADA